MFDKPSPDPIDESQMARWPAGGHVLERRQRMSIGLAVALLELLALFWLLYESSRIPLSSAQAGGDGGSLAFALSSGSAAALGKDHTHAMKTIAPSQTLPATTRDKTDIIKPKPLPTTPPVPAVLAEQASHSEMIAPTAALGTKNSPTEPDGTGQGAPAGMAGAGNGDYFDPYVGAAPQYRAPVTDAPTGPEQFAADAVSSGAVARWLGGGPPSRADEAGIVLIAQVRLEVIRAKPSSHGHMLFAIRTDAGGRIIAVRIEQSSVPPTLSKQIEQMLLGRTLPPSNSDWRELPILLW